MKNTIIPGLLAILLVSCSPQRSNSEFSFQENEEKVDLLENGNAIFSYNKAQNSPDNEHFFTNYIHPLYSLNGDTLTEEFPEDHYHHRGVFWAWHQMYVNGESVGDGWTMENISQEVTSVKTTKDLSSAKLKISTQWKSPLFESNKPFLSEETTITVLPMEDNIRKIDFIIALKALVKGVEIGGSDNEKGYGGFCIRLKDPEDITFVSENKLISPKTNQVEAGPWMDFFAPFGKDKNINGVAILCHPETPNHPAPWILRNEKSMQNIVYPGQNPVTIPVDEFLTLNYRVIIHDGESSSIDLDELYAEYQKVDF